ncbi:MULTISPECIES: hypothetical protein [unclassified Cryobacterium]|jgi:hypothetical protein|uniref:hypothetical protein n=1 Tax=unclassified Cryobacterium TaxID=2649013 RepID=UPI002AB56A07|nr:MULTISPECIES: hypothetical protein [unclassified Cryobacterium]MDY7542923.1 hypothetical protein [Cryobacterium sp. 5B3]MEA9999233.1 hypothetical protein [Cryobacterium sp. RTS3]MEB0265382.1 hypothetical protein [Cryobacterium sp. 10I5]MEB0274902.1 hypothetical protein [Cryobacterium sp. 5B3]
MARTLTPARGFWIGLVMTVLGLVTVRLLYTSLFGPFSPDFLSTGLMQFVGVLLPGLVLPLGMALMVTSVVVRALADESVISIVKPDEATEDTPTWPLRLTSRAALLLGLAFAAIGLVAELNISTWTQTIQGDSTFLRDFVVYLGGPLSDLLLPLGVLLVAGAWILRTIEDRQGAE